MCGRYYLGDNLEKLLKRYGIEDNNNTSIVKTGEIFPADYAPFIVKNDTRQLKFLKWGIMPSFSKRLIINGRWETINVKPTFKEAFISRRCIIPVNEYFEWERDISRKTKYRIYSKDDEILSLGGVYTSYKDIKGNSLEGFIVITKTASSKIGKIHDRMPVIIGRDCEVQWLDPKSEISELKKSVTFYDESQLDFNAV